MTTWNLRQLTVLFSTTLNHMLLWTLVHHVTSLNHFVIGTTPSSTIIMTALKSHLVLDCPAPNRSCNFMESPLSSNLLFLPTAQSHLFLWTAKNIPVLLTTRNHRGHQTAQIFTTFLIVQNYITAMKIPLPCLSPDYLDLVAVHLLSILGSRKHQEKGSRVSINVYSNFLQPGISHHYHSPSCSLSVDRKRRHDSAVIIFTVR